LPSSSFGGGVKAKDLYISCITVTKALKDFNCGCLSGAIGAEECEYLTLLDSQV
jgi:hypothetical protein